MHGRRIAHASGKVLGGSSSINAMNFQRGNPLDYERWGADAGMEDWDFAHCLPYFKLMENVVAGADEWRGGSGPLKVERGLADNPLAQAMFTAIEEAGYSRTDDVNGYRQEGFSTFDRNIFRGRAQRLPRLPASVRGRLIFSGRCCVVLVSRVVIEDGRAVGVEVRRGLLEERPAREVILCGGAINSPQLLQLSAYPQGP